MKKLLFLIALVTFLSAAASAQVVSKLPNWEGLWKPDDSSTPIQITEPGSDHRYIFFTNNSSHIGAGYRLSPKEARLIQTMSGNGCSVDMYIVLNQQDENTINVRYEFIEGACGWKKGQFGNTVIRRLPGNAPANEIKDVPLPNINGFWKASDNPTSSQITEYNTFGRRFATFTLGESHVGAGYWVSATQAKLLQTMRNGSCTVDMSLVFNQRSADVIDIKYEFLESKCGWTKGTTGAPVLNRVPENRLITGTFE